MMMMMMMMLTPMCLVCLMKEREARAVTSQMTGRVNTSRAGLETSSFVRPSSPLKERASINIETISSSLTGRRTSFISSLLTQTE